MESQRESGTGRDPEGDIELTPEVVPENPTGVVADEESASVEKGGDILKSLQSVFSLPDNYFEGFTPEQRDDFIGYLTKEKKK